MFGNFIDLLNMIILANIMYLAYSCGLYSKKLHMNCGKIDYSMANDVILAMGTTHVRWDMLFLYNRGPHQIHPTSQHLYPFIKSHLTTFR